MNSENICFHALIGKINYDQVNQPGISNLITIMATIKGVKIDNALDSVKNLSYKDFKKLVGDLIVAELEPIQKKMQYFLSSEGTKELEEILLKGALEAQKVAHRLMLKVNRKIGFGGI